MTSDKSGTIRRALISVSDKTGIVSFARSLTELGIEVISTGGTHKLLKEEGIPVLEISNYTGFPEIMDGRVKTLHPKIHGGILSRRDFDSEVMAKQNILPIDLVVVNLYPFESTVANPKCDLSTAIENIDIGGPTMLRAAAKNHKYVSVIVDPSDYQHIIDQLKCGQTQLNGEVRFELAVKTFEHTANYDGAIANYLGKNLDPASEFPRTINMQFIKQQNIRYGENPHQSAAFYTEKVVSEPSISSTRQLQGKELSFNNIADTDAAIECVSNFEKPSCVIVKHANPCGVASGKTLLEAYEKVNTLILTLYP